MLVSYGAIWFSSRDQHPYQGPSLGVIGAVYIIVAVLVVVSGPSRREGRITAIPVLAEIVGG